MKTRNFPATHFTCLPPSRSSGAISSSFFTYHHGAGANFFLFRNTTCVRGQRRLYKPASRQGMISGSELVSSESLFRRRLDGAVSFRTIFLLFPNDGAASDATRRTEYGRPGFILRTTPTVMRLHNFYARPLGNDPTGRFTSVTDGRKGKQASGPQGPSSIEWATCVVQPS